MANYNDTLYAAMLRARQQQALQGWMQAEQEKERKFAQDDQFVDHMARAFGMVQQAQEAEHKRKLETAKMLGMAGKPIPQELMDAGPAYGQMAEASGALYQEKRAAEALADKRKTDRYLTGIRTQHNLSQKAKDRARDIDFDMRMREIAARGEQARKTARVRDLYGAGGAGTGAAGTKLPAFKPMRIAEKYAAMIQAEGRQYASEEDELPEKHQQAARQALELGALYEEVYRQSGDSQKVSDELTKALKEMYGKTVGAGRDYGGGASGWSAGKQRALNKLNSDRAAQGLPPLSAAESGL